LVRGTQLVADAEAPEELLHAVEAEPPAACAKGAEPLDRLLKREL
jgi:hypothetical protein